MCESAQVALVIAGAVVVLLLGLLFYSYKQDCIIADATKHAIDAQLKFCMEHPEQCCVKADKTGKAQ